MSYGQFEQFIRNMSRVMASVNTRLQRDLTMRSRLSRRFSQREVSEFLNIDATYLIRLANEDPAFPEGEKIGRERTYSPHEIMLIRALLDSNPNARRKHLHWRGPTEPVKVVTFGAQKGGTGKSLSAAHFAQYINLFYGLRVGVIDADPQSTISLYFADDALPLFDAETATVADFMGVGDPGAKEPTLHSTDTLNKMWRPTPWPGVRLIPGGANIQNGDISMFFMSRNNGVPIYRLLKDAIVRWEESHRPSTETNDFRTTDGSFDLERYNNALNETLDVIVIDQQPSLTLVQLNGLLAADSVVMPQTMKGFDLATLATFVNSIAEYLDFIVGFDKDFVIGSGAHFVLPTIVQEQNDRDTSQILDLYEQAPNETLQVWYARSDAIANAADEYKSIYEYMPDKNRRQSSLQFMRNANAVNDAIVGKVWPGFEQRGFADTFIKERWEVE